MRLAVLGDVHGNLLALEAVIQDFTVTSPDAVVNLGDHVSGPLWSAETADLLMAHNNWVHIRGNHDRQMAEQSLESMGKSDHAAFLQLKEHHIAWLASLPPVASLEADVVACHGTLSNDCEYLLEDVRSGFARVARSSELRCTLGVVTGTVLCGHSHVPRAVQVDEDTLVVNPGGVGIQAYCDPDHRFPHVVENGSPHARYVLMQRCRHHWEITMRALKYDWETAAQRADVGHRADWSHALRTGYALRA